MSNKILVEVVELEKYILIWHYIMNYLEEVS